MRTVTQLVIVAPDKALRHGDARSSFEEDQQFEPGVAVQLAVPLGALEDRIAVVVHDQAVATTVFGEFELALADLSGNVLEPVLQDVVLAPGEHYAVEVVPQ